MIEKVMPLEIPPGIVKNGTLYERAGRWADGNLVRFTNGVPQAIAGSTAVTLGATITGAPRGAYAYYGAAASRIVLGTASKLYGIAYSFSYPGTPHIVTDLTPAAPFGAAVKWWQFAHLQDDVIGVNSLGTVYTSIAGAASTNTTPDSFAVYRGVVVTPENFVMLLRSDGVAGDTHSIQWASQNSLTFTPASTNSAGSLAVPCASALVTGLKVRGETLLLSGSDAWVARYVGAPLYYGVREVGGHCGILGPRAAVVAGSTAYWMGDHGFYQYDGYVQPIDCDIADEIFPNINRSALASVFAIVVGSRHEIWWHWPAGAATAPDRVAIYNYRNRTWSRGDLSRSAGVGDGVWLVSGETNQLNFPAKPPVLFTEAGAMHEHEEQDSVLADAWIETGPVMLDPAGAQLLRVQKLIPDNNQTTAAEDGVLYVGTYPKVAESSTAIVIAAAGGEIDVRQSGRYIRLRQELSRIDSRVGKWRVGLTAEGRR